MSLNFDKFEEEFKKLNFEDFAVPDKPFGLRTAFENRCIEITTSLQKRLAKSQKALLEQELQVLQAALKEIS